MLTNMSNITMAPTPCPSVPGYGCERPPSAFQNEMFVGLALAIPAAVLLIAGLRMAANKCRSVCESRFGLFGSKAATNEQAGLLDQTAPTVQIV